MRTETLPALTQPDDPPNVTPCHTGRAARVCAFDVALLEQRSDSLAQSFGACISCGVGLGEPHLPTCAFKTVSGAA